MTMATKHQSLSSQTQTQRPTSEVRSSGSRRASRVKSYATPAPPYPSSLSIMPAEIYIPSPPTSPTSVYTQGQGPVETSEHVVQLKDRTAHPWASLRINHVNKSSDGLPSFQPGDVVHGMVDLDLQEARTMKEITVSLRGTYMANNPTTGERSYDQEHTEEEFLHLSFVIWKSGVSSAAAGNDKPSPSSASSSSSSRRKMQGQYSFAFAIPIPVKIDSGNIHAYFDKAPPSFKDSITQNFVAYEVSVVFKAGMFQSSQKLQTPIVVLPIKHPTPPSRFRLAAYRASRIPAGPEDDPDGWTTAPQCTFNAKMFQRLDVDVKCSLSIANPTLYPIGKTIHLQLKIEPRYITDEHIQAIDLLSKPESIAICLVRKITVDDSGMSVRTIRDQGCKSRPRVSQVANAIAMGLCWPDRLPYNNSHHLRRVVHCEIPVPSGSVPSFNFRNLSVEYYVYLLPFTAPGLPTIKKDALISIPITLVKGRAKTKSYIPDGIRGTPLIRLPGTDDMLRMGALEGKENCGFLMERIP